MCKLILGLVSAAALSLTALPAMAQHHHHHFRGFGFGFSPFLLPYAAPLLFGGSPYAAAPCGAGYGYGAPGAYGAYGAYGAVQPPCAQGLYAYPYGFFGPGGRRFHHVQPPVNTK